MSKSKLGAEPNVSQCLPKQFFKAAVVNLEERLSKRDMRIPTSHSPMLKNYHPSEDISNKLNPRGVQSYQELIGELRWAVKIRRVDIFLEVALLYLHLYLPRSGHLQAVNHIFGYLKQVPKQKLYFNPVSPSISKYQFHKIYWEEFIDIRKKQFQMICRSQEANQCPRTVLKM